MRIGEWISRGGCYRALNQWASAGRVSIVSRSTLKSTCSLRNLVHETVTPSSVRRSLQSVSKSAKFPFTAVTSHLGDLERLAGVLFIFPGPKEVLERGAVLILELFFGASRPVRSRVSEQLCHCRTQTL